MFPSCSRIRLPGRDRIRRVIVMPGGGYTHLVMEQEGAYEARWLAAHGVAAFVLEYRLAPAYLYPTQSKDVSRAIRYVRSHAAELGVKPDAIGDVGILGGRKSGGIRGDDSQRGQSCGGGPDRSRLRPARLRDRVVRTAWT